MLINTKHYLWKAKKTDNHSFDYILQILIKSSNTTMNIDLKSHKKRQEISYSDIQVHKYFSYTEYFLWHNWIKKKGSGPKNKIKNIPLTDIKLNLIFSENFLSKTKKKTSTWTILTSFSVNLVLHAKWHLFNLQRKHPFFSLCLSKEKTNSLTEIKLVLISLKISKQKTTTCSILNVSSVMFPYIEKNQ